MSSSPDSSDATSIHILNYSLAPSALSSGSQLTTSQFLSLREITINSRPLVRRAIQFSCDGDLAVAADDSVHVLVPEFPDFSECRERRKAAARDGRRHGHDDPTSEVEDEEGESGSGRYDRYALRAQYSEGGKQFPVSYPPLDPRVNKELFTATRVPFPYGDTADADASSSDSDRDSAESDASSLDDEGAGPASLGHNQPYGAGYGPITGPGSSMNHVVCIGWSPSGLGVNRRPVLGVLTGAGTLVMYGDGTDFASMLRRANQGMLPRRELNSWIVVWGVGERLTVPRQQTEISECIRGFAWAREIAPGQALLATINDVREVAIISVQTVSTTEEPSPKGGLFSLAEPHERVDWLVREIARFKPEGPHGTPNPFDPDWVPCGTSFGLKWGPWLTEGSSRTCLLSYVDWNYVGFRKITIKESWTRGELPDLEIGSADSYGTCVHLSTDAFVEFEDRSWTLGHLNSCRGIIVTGFSLKSFEIVLPDGPAHQQEKHSVWDCGTVYSEPRDQRAQNPIVDLVIHPPDLASPTPIPLYTLVRMSATATTKDWYETNFRPPGHPTADPRPQWVRSIAQKLEVRVPIDMHLTRRYDDDSDSDDSSTSDSEESDESLDEDLNSLAEDDDNADGVSGDPALDGPQIHPHRFRLWGLTLSPGGGVAAVLASSHSTQQPEQGGWHTLRSSILFGHKPRWRSRRRLQERQQQQPGDLCPIDPRMTGAGMNVPADTGRTLYSTLTTEAKLFEYLYGGGPEVPGVHYYPIKNNTDDDNNNNNNNNPDDANLTASAPPPPPPPPPPAVSSSSSSSNNNDELARLFAPIVASQTCDLCGNPMRRGAAREGALSGCEQGHFFGTCATSGLAVQTPGGTRSCGACGLRTMRAAMLVAKMPPERRDEVRRLVADGVCGACGGKFLS